MSVQARVFSIVGDSNVNRFVGSVNRRSCPDLTDAQVLSCGRIQVLAAALEKVSPETTHCILSCITNFLTDAKGTSAAGLRVEPVIEEFLRIVSSSCSDFPARVFLVCPPMFRTTPGWYEDGLPEILQKFSTVMTSAKPDNLHLLPSFSTPTYEADGVHLTPYSGLEFIFHLFDSSKKLISSLTSPVSSALASGVESGRVLEDRVMVMEQKYGCLSRSFNAKVAVDSELADFQENVRNEVFFTISGLSKISSEKRGKDWQAQAVSDVAGVIQTLLGKALPIVAVLNASGRGSDAVVRYHVKMQSAADSQEIRSKFGSFFIGGEDRRPQALKDVSISNRVTPGTQVRVAVLKLLAKRYLDRNAKAKAKVIGYESRPMLRLTPPPSSSDRRVLNYTYIEAVRNLPVNFSSEELKPIMKKAVNAKFNGKLKSIFIVLDDDMVSKFRGAASRVKGAIDVEIEDESEISPESEVFEVQQGPSGSGSRKRLAMSPADSGILHKK